MARIISYSERAFVALGTQQASTLLASLALKYYSTSSINGKNFFGRGGGYLK
jgi:hypothetical protein